MGLPVRQVRASGGGAQNALWRQILADVFNTEVVTVGTSEGAAYGAALLAGVGCRLFASVDAACDATISIGEGTTPDASRADVYGKLYEVYRELYPALRGTMHALGDLGQP